MKYQKFMEANPAPDGRIEAMLSLVTPDSKGITLWGMKPGEPYTRSSLYANSREFAGWLPVRLYSTWQYCNGNPYQNTDGSLHKIGAVVDVRETAYPWEKEERAYVLTDAGEDIGKPAVALGTRLAGELYGKAEFASMWRLMGAVHSHGKTRGMTAVYRIIKALVEKVTALRETDIQEITGLSNNVVGRTLDRLSYSSKRPGFIDYHSPSREIKGRVARKWARYKPTKKADEADADSVWAEAKALRPNFGDKATLLSVFSKLKDSRDMSCREGTDAHRTSGCLSILKDMGYAEADFQGGKTASKASANKFTWLVWRKFLEPIGNVCENMNASLPEFTAALDYYRNNKSAMEAAVRRQMTAYDMERSNSWVNGSRHAEHILLSILTSEPKKLSEILDEFNEMCQKKLSPGGIHARLKSMVQRGRATQTSRGHYSTSPDAASI